MEDYIYIKDTYNLGLIHEYGKDQHDSIIVSDDGSSLHYYNLQTGEDSKYGRFVFCDKDGRTPAENREINNNYFNIGGFCQEERHNGRILPYNNYVKDTYGYGLIHEYGKDQHDSIVVSDDGRYLYYYNLQIGEGSKYGGFVFCDKNGRTPADLSTHD